MQRSSLNRIPGRLAFNSVSIYSKGGTTIDTELMYKQAPVEIAGLGRVDNIDDEAWDEITLTPDGRMTTALAAVLWPYNNPTMGAGIFTDTDVPAVIHGIDSSLDTHPAAAVLQMPQMIFHPTKTLVGQMKLLCLRGHTSGALNAWSTSNSLRTFANSGGTFVDSAFADGQVLHQDYQLTWGSVSGWSSLDFYDGLVFEPKVDYVDDTVATHGLINKRIKSVSGTLKGIPIGLARTAIDTYLNIQGTGAARGASGAAKANSVTVAGADGKTYLAFPLGQLVKSKIQNGVEQLREGEVAWECLPTLSSGARSAYWTNPIA